MNAAAAPSFQPRDFAVDGCTVDAKLPEQRANEPSMEEILASIRKIISDDSALPKFRKTAPVSVEAPLAPVHVAVTEQVAFGAAAPVPHVHEAVVAPEPVHLHVEPPVPASVANHEPAAVPETAAVAVKELAEVELEEEEVMDLADHSLQEADFAFLAAEPVHAPPAVAVEQPHHLQAPPAAAPLYVPLPAAAPEMLTSPGTDAAVSASFQSLVQTVMLNNTAMIENMTREMLRPMLKTWLDDNLPVMVERLVRAEIERVARGGR